MHRPLPRSKRHRPLPERRPPDAPGPTEAEIARIDALTATGRTNWFALLAYLAFVTVTTLGVQDIDFFVDSRQTELPLVGVSIPTFSFFVFAPILGAALYAYLHLHIRKVTEALAETPTGTPPLEERVKPWLLNDYVLRKRPDLAIRPRPLDRLARLTTLLLVWWAGPIVLIMMWERSWVAHALWLSALNAACVMVATYAGVLSWQKMRADVRDQTPRVGLATCAMLALCLPVAWLTAANSKGIWEWRVGYDRNGFDTDRTLAERVEAWRQEWEKDYGYPLSPTRLDRAKVWLWDLGTAFAELDSPDLSGAMLSVLPPEQASHDIARHRYRTEFCRRHGIEARICDLAASVDYNIPSHVMAARLEWCAGRSYGTRLDDRAQCEDHFRRIDTAFSSEWQTFRAAQIDTLEKPDLSGRDLRHANLSGADLTGVNFSNAQMEYADLTGARMEAARLYGISGSGAVFKNADLVNADFGEAVLTFADFQMSDLRRANFGSAILYGTSFRLSSLQQSDFLAARMSGVDFSHTDLRAAHLLFATKPTGTLLHNADIRSLRGLGLQSGFFDRSIGNPKTLLPKFDSLPPYDTFRLASCWSEPPEGWDDLAATGVVRTYSAKSVSERLDENRMKIAYICPPGTVPQKTGTPWPLDQPPPWEVDPDWQPQDRGPVTP